QEAWEVLGDAQQRQEYDARRRGQRDRPQAYQMGSGSGEVRAPSGWRGPAGSGTWFSEAGGTLHLELRMSRTEATTGGEIDVGLPAVGSCPQCGGTGRGIWSICSVC